MAPRAAHRQAGSGEVDDEEFVACVRTSLPYAWSVIAGLVRRLGSDGEGFADAEGFADNEVPPRAYRDFVSPRPQILNQRPELVNC
jgi:hypothetical protein